MVNTVAVYSPTGLVGKALVPLLTNLQKEGKLNLVLIHRPSSDLSVLALPTEIETRAIDFEGETDENKLLAAVKGIDLIISTAGFTAIVSQLKIIETLGKTEKKTVFIPATFGAKLDGLPYPQIAGLAGMLSGYSAKAGELGVPIANVHAGIFAPYFFAFSAFKTDIKSNTVVAGAERLQNALPLTTVEYLAAALAQIAAGDVASLAETTRSAVENWITGQQLVDAFTQVNGEKPTVLDYTEKDLDEDLTIHAEGLGLVRAGYFLKWKAGSFIYPNEIKVAGWKPFDLVDTVKAVKGA